MQKVTPFLWFDGKAEEAMNFYTSIFRNSKVRDVMRYGESGPGPKGSVMSAKFEIEGQEFIALNSGPAYSFTPAISLFVMWERGEKGHDVGELLAGGGKTEEGGAPEELGLLSGEIPPIIGESCRRKETRGLNRVMEAMLEMVKLDIKGLQRAYDGRA